MIRDDGTRLALFGPLTLATVACLIEEGGRYVNLGDRVIDLSGTTRVDSAALALLLSWARAAKAAGRKMSIEHAPPELISLAAVYDVEAFLRLSA